MREVSAVRIAAGRPLEQFARLIMPPMSRRLPLLLLTILASGAASSAPESARLISTRDHPVVVELFQSQGCSSCPPANANLNALADREDVLALSFAVTYWDQLGWKDTFGSSRYTARQWDYAHRSGRPQVATPQVIVNGEATIVGSNRDQLAATIARAGPPRGGPDFAVEGEMLKVAGQPVRDDATVWLVRYDPRSRNVPIRAGENGGRTLPHRDIVRELTALGRWSGTAVSFSIPRSREAGLASAVLVQRGVGGPIIAARRL
jgi:hypothetical protein